MKSLERRIADLESAAAADDAGRTRIVIQRIIVSPEDRTHLGVVLKECDPITGAWTTRRFEGEAFDAWCAETGHVRPAPRPQPWFEKIVPDADQT
jgi:hypothetical protein